MGRSRSEHVEFCKQRALEYIEQGDVMGAWDSMCSDLTAHAETKDHSGMMTGLRMIMNGQLSQPEAMREFILGFN